MKKKSNQVIFRTTSVIFRTNPFIFRTNALILRTTEEKYERKATVTKRNTKKPTEFERH